MTIRYATIPFGSKGSQVCIVVGETPTKYKTVRYNASRGMFNHKASYWDYETKTTIHREGSAVSPVKKDLVEFITRDELVLAIQSKASSFGPSLILEKIRKVEEEFAA